MNKLSSSWPTKTIAGFVASVLLWLLAAKMQQSHERVLATSTMKTLQQIELGSTTRSQVESLLRTYTPYQVSGLGADAIQIAFANRRWLPFIGSSQWIWITVEIKNDLVVSRSMLFAEEPGRGVSVEQHAGQNELTEHTEPHRDVTFAGAVDAQRSIVKVRDDALVSAEQRSADWQADFRCFKFISGCSNMASVLPAAHLHWKLRVRKTYGKQHRGEVSQHGVRTGTGRR